MSLVTSEISSFMANSSWIRKMFEAGIELKKKYGEDAVCDFSLGNPDLPPPPAVKQALFQIAERADQPFSLGYMPNAGFSAVREVVAKKIAEENADPGFPCGDVLRSGGRNQCAVPGDSDAGKRSDLSLAVFCGVCVLCGQFRGKAGAGAVKRFLV